MFISKLFAGKNFKASDFENQSTVFTITSVVEETVESGKPPLPVLKFAGEVRGLVLNKTNGEFIAGLYGDDTTAWTNQPIELFTSTTLYNGQNVPCIRARQPVQQQPAQPIQQSAQPATQPATQPAAVDYGNA